VLVYAILDGTALCLVLFVEGDCFEKTGVFMMGILALVLVFGLVLTGCDITINEDVTTYDFKFKIDNNTSYTITKVEFFNGNSSSSSLLKGFTGTQSPGTRSEELAVSGFTAVSGASTHYCGVKITLSNATSAFGYSSYSNGSKIVVTVGSSGLNFSSGTW
jgi:hypothetical protein